jgi:hypothetical protein
MRTSSLLLLIVATLIGSSSLYAQNAGPAYRFAAGQRLYYQRTVEVDDPLFDNSYMQSQECRIEVEKVDRAGNATVTLTVLKDTLFMRSPAAAPSLAVAQLQPKIRFTISPEGAITSGTILTYSQQLLTMRQMANSGSSVGMISDSQRILLEAALWFPRLPRFSDGSAISLDTTARVVDVPITKETAGMPGLVLEQRFTTAAVASRLVGNRKYAGVECQLVLRNELHRQPLPDDGLLHRQEVTQEYFRSSDGLLVHSLSTSISSVIREGAGLTRRVTQSMVGLW